MEEMKDDPIANFKEDQNLSDNDDELNNIDDQ
jgi:hypothetical protein